MKRAMSVGVVLLLFAVLVPSAAFGQQTGSGKAKFQLGRSYPNPFNPEVWIPFTLNEEAFVGGRPAVVSIRIENILGQLVAIPAALNHPSGDALVNQLEYTTPGEKLAYWDGLDRNGRKVGSAIYLLRVVVNGERAPPQKLVVAK